MKKLNVGLILPVVALCALLSFSPIKANADTVTLYVNYQDLTAYNYTGFYTDKPSDNNISFSNGAVGPYLATLNGDGYNNRVVEVMCYDYNIDVYYMRDRLIRVLSLRSLPRSRKMNCI